MTASRPISALFLILLWAGGALAQSTVTLSDAISAYDKGDDAAAFSMFTDLAEQDNVRAIEILADMYFHGEGTPIDYAAGLKWSQRGAALGSAESEFDISVVYFNGEVGLPNEELAVEWMMKAVEHGSYKAQHMLAGLQLVGDVVPRDVVAGEATERRLAALGHERAQFGLGIWLAFSPFNPQIDFTEAGHWIGLAAEQRYRPALQLMGTMAQFGFGAPADRLTAAMWYRLSAQQGCLAGALSLKAVSELLSQREIAEAEAMADRWSTTHKPRPRHDYSQAEAASGFCSPMGLSVRG